VADPGRPARALVLDGPRRTHLAEFDVPVVGAQDAVLEVEACGLCGTDHEQWSGALAAQTPVVPGHEVVGRVLRIGPGAEARWGIHPGDRVVVEPRQVCGTCTSCRAGRPRRCLRHSSADSYGQIPLSEPPGLWGGYATVQYLSAHSVVHPVDPSIDPVVAAMFNAVANGVRWGSSLPATAPGDVVAILGPGLRGLAAAAAARAAGARFVLVTGRGPRDQSRLALARTFGADLAVDVATDDPVEALREAAGGLADVVVDATANAPGAFVQAMELAARYGRVVVAGIHGDVDVPGFRPDLIVVKELRLLGALGAETTDFRAALALLESAYDRFAAVPATVVGLEGLPGLLAAMADGAGDAPVFAAVVPADEPPPSRSQASTPSPGRP
jgi:alcohol dehydrogenase